MSEKPIVISLTPVRNEAWILDRFLQAASLWADHIIIADQMSTDGSREIAGKYEKVILIDNHSETYNESDRQKLLIHEARKIAGPRLLISLDADEFFTPNVLTSVEWQEILSSKPGTIMKFQLANLRPGFTKMWLGQHFPWGYMDDGYRHEGQLIHSVRLPLPTDGPTLILNDIRIMHFQYTDWDRMASKHRWYQCFELINSNGRNALKIYRQYHHMYGLPSNKILTVPKEWITQYGLLGIDIKTPAPEGTHWWDDKTLEMMEKYGAAFFKKISVWDFNWSEKAGKSTKNHPDKYRDPRSLMDKGIQFWLRLSQKYYLKRPFRQIDQVISSLFGY